jgi:hypothetical protein
MAHFSVQEFDFIGRIQYIHAGVYCANGGVLSLSKLCQCGQKMNIRLRTVIYKKKIEIDNVPIYTCEACQKSEVLQGVKGELADLISQFSQSPEKQQFFFNETSELAYLLMTSAKKEFKHYPVDKILEDRINELLDLLLLARSLNDEPWVEDMLKRLSQITKQRMTTYEIS